MSETPQVGKRITIENNCPGCGQRHDIWIPGDDYFDTSKKHYYRCPENDTTYVVTGLGAAELESEPEAGDVTGWEEGEEPPNELQ